VHSLAQLQGAIMTAIPISRRDLFKTAGSIAGAVLLYPRALLSQQATADYTLTIGTSPIELAKDHIVSITTYNGQFPGPLLRFKEGKPVTVEIHNNTDVPEQLHWHGQFLAADVDGSAEEGSPFIPPHGSRRITFTPGPSGFRFYHSHVRAGRSE